MKTILITGASGGIGKALTIIFDANGYNLLLQYNSNSPPPVCCESIRIDFTDENWISKFTKFIDDRRIDILINNAGLYLSEQFTEIQCEDIKKITDVNFIAPILMTKLVWGKLIESKGVVININSIANRRSNFGESLYSATKCGLEGFSRAVQIDAIKNNISVINLNLGAVNTGMIGERINKEKAIDPCEIAQLIFNLCRSYKSLRITDVTVERKEY